MDDLDDLEAFDNYQHFRRNQVRVRRDFFVELSERDFVSHFRFSKGNVERLTGLLVDRLGDQHYLGLTPETQVKYVPH